MATKRRSRGKKSDISSEPIKQTIISIALQHFAQNGFSGTNLKAIAEDAKVANSLINYHFKDKEGLFEVCIDQFARTRMEAIVRLLSEPRNKDELRLRIELFVEEMISAVLADPYCYEIVEKEMRAENPIVFKVFENTMLHAFKAVVGFFEQAKSKGLISKKADPLICASLLFSCSSEIVRKEVIAARFFKISLRDPEFRKKYVYHIVELFMNGVSA